MNSTAVLCVVVLTLHLGPLKETTEVDMSG
jgi:hypothetical protein